MKDENVYHNLYSLIPFLPKPLHESDKENLTDTVDTFIRRHKRYNQDGRFDNLINEVEYEFERWKENPDAYNSYHNIAGTFDKENEELINMVNNKKVSNKENNIINKKDKKNKKIKIIKNTIIGGTIIAVGLSGAVIGGNYIKNKNQENLASNVCVEYTVESGITNTYLENMFYEYGYASYAVSGAERNLSSNKDNPFIGDIIVGRTTKEKAEKLVENHGATIISYEEAVSLLKNNNSLKGEFKKAADGDSNFVWYVIEKTKTV